MLSLDSSGHAWLGEMCAKLKDRNCFDDEEVRSLFDTAAKWADDNKIDYDKKIDYVAAYIESRDSNAVPAIPEFVRRYCKPCCAKLDAGRDRPRTERRQVRSHPARKRKPHHRPSVAARR